MGRNSKNPSEYSTSRFVSSAKYSSSLQSPCAGNSWAISQVGSGSPALRAVTFHSLQVGCHGSKTLREYRQPKAIESARCSKARLILAMSVAAVEGLELAHVITVRRAKGVVIDGPARGVVGVPVTVLLDEPVQELEEMPRRSQIPQRVAQIVVADRVVDELAEPRCLPVSRRVGSTWRSSDR